MGAPGEPEVRREEGCLVQAQAGKVTQVCLHVPHSSTLIPDGSGLREDVLSGVLSLTDWSVDALFDFPGTKRIVAPISRLAVDVERFRDDLMERMSARGMGAVYERGANGEDLGRDRGQRDRLLREYYDPHHALLNEWAARAIAAHGSAILVDAHSFPSRPLPCDENQRHPRPDVCIGTSGVHSPPGLIREILSRLEGVDLAVDAPYSGSMVPSLFMGDPRLVSVMVEVNRGLYMYEDALATNLFGFEMTKKLVGVIVDVVIGYGRGPRSQCSPSFPGIPIIIAGCWPQTASRLATATRRGPTGT